MDHKTPLSFNSRKFVEMHCNSLQWVHNKTKKHGELQQGLHCSWFDWLLWRWLKRGQNADWKKKKIIIVKILHWLKIGLLLVISENFLRTLQKNNVLDFCVSCKKPKSNSLFRKLFSQRILKVSESNTFLVQILLQYFCFEVRCFQTD